MNSTAARLWRYSLVTIGVVAILVLLLLSGVSLAIYTEAGSRRLTQVLLARLNALDGIHIQSSNITGNLLRGLTLTELVVDIPAAKIEAQSIRASWNPYSVLTGSFYLSALDITALSVSMTPPDSAANATEAVDAISLLRLQPLPVNIAIGALTVSDMTIVMPNQTLGITDLSLAAELIGQDLEIQDMHLESAGLVLDLSLQAGLHDNIPLLASLNWEYQGPLFANYDLAVGSAAITGDLSNLVIQHELLAPEAIHSSGNVVAPLSAADRSLAFTNTTASLRLPWPGISDYLFENLSLVTRWDGGDLNMDLQSAFSGTLLPASQLSASGSLSATSLDLSAASLRTATGTLATSGQLDWSGPLQSAFNFNLTEQSPLQYLPMTVPVELNDVTASGNVNFGIMDEVPNIRVVVDDFNGITSGYELTGETAVTVIGNAVQLENLRLNTIANELRVSGEYRDEIHLSWELVAPELEQLLAGISGAASSSGQIDGALDNPAINATLQLQGLASGLLSAENIAISMAGTRKRLRGSLVAEEMVLAATTEQRIELLSLQVIGNLAAHAINAEVASSFGDATVSVAGGISDLAVPQWQGNLNEARLRSDFGNWEKQAGASAITLSRTSTSLAETCWQLDTIDLCLNISQPTTDQLSVSATLANFPLAEFDAGSASGTALIRHPAMPRLPQGITLQGGVAATVAGIVSLDGAPPQIDFSLNASDAVLSIASAELVDAAIANELLTVDAQHYNWDTLAVNGQWVNNSWNLFGNAALSQANVEGAFPGLNGVVNSSLAIGPNGNLAGAATASFAELGWIQAFLPELSAVSGSLYGAIDISGTLAAPLVAGELSLVNGTAAISRLGITLNGIQSTIAAQSSGEVLINGAVAAGNGAISFSGNITDLYSNSRSLQATLQGTDFQLANIEDLQLEVSPELSLTATSEMIQLNGSLDIPVLNLTLLELPETAVDESRDTVITDYPADQPELARSRAAGQSMLFNIPVAAEIRLTLGDAVSFSGFGMAATLDGDLAIQQQLDGRNLTYGELSIVEGNYRIYGQTLDLRQGKLLFFGAIDNPALDIRAVRVAEDVTVGVLMNGTLKNIRSQLYSTPVLPDNDIIAVLVTGRPASELLEQDGTAVLGAIASLGLDRSAGLAGQIRNTLGLDTLGLETLGASNGDTINSSALTIGKYLTPDIFVRYGVGLFDRQSKVAIDYSLSERIILQAESGQYQSVDLTYTVER